MTMNVGQDLSLAHQNVDLTDPRIDGFRRHERIDIIVVCAVVAGADTWDGIQDDEGQAQREPLRRSFRSGCCR